MAGNQALDKQYSVKFFSTLVTNLQKLCQAYISYDKNIEVSGYLCIDIDNSKKERYVLSELLQNSGSVVSESYCTKVFRTVPPPPASTPVPVKQIAKEAALVNPNPVSYVTNDGRPKLAQERRSSLPSQKPIDASSYPELSNGPMFGHEGLERQRMAMAQRPKQSSFDHDKENAAARLARDMTHRLSETPESVSAESNTWHQPERPTRLPSFAHISRRKSFTSASLFPSVEPIDLDCIKVEGSKVRLPCAQAKLPPAPSRPVGTLDGLSVPPGTPANLPSLGQMMEAFTASRSPVGQDPYAQAERFPTPSAPVSTPQPGHSPSSQPQTPHFQPPPTVWSPPDTPPAKSRTPVAISRSQQDVFMQMLPQGYGDGTTKPGGVQMVHTDAPETKAAAAVGSFGGRTSEDTLDVDMEDMGGGGDHSIGGDHSMSDVNPSLSLSGMDQNMLSEYMMSSAQVTDIQRKRNAQLNCQRYALRLFCEFHQNLLGAMPSLDSLSAEQVDTMLSQFYATSKKGNGEDFTVSSLRSIQYYLESHLFENYIHSGSRAAVFRNSRQALRTRCEELRVKQKTTPVSKRQFTATDIDMLFEKGQLGSSSPDVLLNSLWFMNVICFGIKGSEHFTLRWGDIILNTDKEGNQFLEYSGAGNSGQADSCLRVYALPHHPHRCCVHLFKQYLGHRPAIALQPDDPFYLNVNAQYKRVGTWFIKEKVSMSRLTSTWRSMLFGAGLPPDKKPPVGFQKGLLIQDIQSPVLVNRHAEYPPETVEDA